MYAYVGRSSVLREKLESLEKSTETKDERNLLKLEVEDDVTLKVIDVFLTFLYSGKFKNTRGNDENDVDPTWVEMLPGLVDLAHKVSELKEKYCVSLTTRNILNNNDLIGMFSVQSA